MQVTRSEINNIFLGNTYQSIAFLKKKKKKKKKCQTLIPSFDDSQNYILRRNLIKQEQDCDLWHACICMNSFMV